MNLCRTPHARRLGALRRQCLPSTTGLGVLPARVMVPYPTSSSRRWMSVKPMENTAPSATTRKKVTLASLRKLRSEQTPITMMTAYDYPTALLTHSSGIDMTLVGDSLSQVALGHYNTNQITLDEMIHHCKAVARGAKTPFIISDMPFGSFEASVQHGVESAVRLVKEGYVDGVKIEGGREIIPLVKRLTEVGIPVMPHLGLQPQRATSLSGYMVQARSSGAAKELYETAVALQQAGAFALLLEAIPHKVASYITDKLDLLTIGIGAGPGTSGQVLVASDVLGVFPTEEEAEVAATEHGQQLQAVKVAKFVRRFGNVGSESRRAVREYIEAVRSGGFPEIGKETYMIAKEEWDEFERSMGPGRG
ncbi:hypothetical protein QFC19_006485 [Naganishia cerealis]|uniref:Uncharacterized protein n=1 Tax=Naganishia cerealis TaxID=610337 RepID=A0ACC2VF62_9TREE|nr:hypothetical protein QFC19_006485 [Naganishia cerealis]